VGLFFASFEHAYGAFASKHRLVALTADIEPVLLNAARTRFAPWGLFEDLPNDGANQFFNSSKEGDQFVCKIVDGKEHCGASDKGVDDKDLKTALDGVWFPMWVAKYMQKRREQFCYLSVIDSDMLFIQPVGRYLPDCGRMEASAVPPLKSDAAKSKGAEWPDWDVSFAAYGPELKVPWADNARKVGLTKNNFTRPNGGMVMVSLRDGRLAWFFTFRWAQVSNWLIQPSVGPEGLQDTFEKWATYLLEEFRGMDQASLALLLSSFDINRLPKLLGWGDECEVCSKAVDVNLNLVETDIPMVGGVQPVVRFRALPAHILNHPESMPGGKHSRDLLMVHLKGNWWRVALMKNTIQNGDATRRLEWNADSLMLYLLCLETWQVALPEESRLPRSLGTFSIQQGRPAFWDN